MHSITKSDLTPKYLQKKPRFHKNKESINRFGTFFEQYNLHMHRKTGNSLDNFYITSNVVVSILNKTENQVFSDFKARASMG